MAGWLSTKLHSFLFALIRAFVVGVMILLRNNASRIPFEICLIFFFKARDRCNVKVKSLVVLVRQLTRMEKDCDSCRCIWCLSSCPGVSTWKSPVSDTEDTEEEVSVEDDTKVEEEEAEEEEDEEDVDGVGESAGEAEGS